MFSSCSGQGGMEEGMGEGEAREDETGQPGEEETTGEEKETEGENTGREKRKETEKEKKRKQKKRDTEGAEEENARARPHILPRSPFFDIKTLVIQKPFGQ